MRDFGFIITSVFWRASVEDGTKYMEKYNLKSVGTISESCMLAVCFCKVLSTARLTVKTTQCRLSISQFFLGNWDEPAKWFGFTVFLFLYSN